VEEDAIFEKLSKEKKKKFFLKPSLERA